MKRIVEEFKKRLDIALSYAGMKPAELAQRTGISDSTISQYRSGYSKPKDERLVLIANVLQVDPAWLMGIDVPMVPASNLTSVELSPHEAAIIKAYRNASDDIQVAVCAVLGIKKGTQSKKDEFIAE